MIFLLDIILTLAQLCLIHDQYYFMLLSLIDVTFICLLNFVEGMECFIQFFKLQRVISFTIGGKSLHTGTIYV